MKKQKLSNEQARKEVAAIIFKVLTKQLCVREAIQAFPADSNDSSIQCAWHALVHYESDEEFRLKDKMYAKEQDDYLETIAFIMEKGNPLPENIAAGYNKYHDKALIPRSEGFMSLIKSLFRFII